MLAAYRLGMSPSEYLDKHTDAEHYAWLAWFELHEWKDLAYKGRDPYECIIGEHVSQETWDRWAAKVQGAKWQLLAKDGVTFGERD